MSVVDRCPFCFIGLRAFDVLGLRALYILGRRLLTFGVEGSFKLRPGVSSRLVAIPRRGYSDS